MTIVQEFIWDPGWIELMSLGPEFLKKKKKSLNIYRGICDYIIAGLMVWKLAGLGFETLL